jgi:hypothetical protein
MFPLPKSGSAAAVLIMVRKTLLLLFLYVMALSSFAQSYPAKPIKPAPIIQRLHASAVEVLRTTEFSQKMVELGLGVSIASSPAAMVRKPRQGRRDRA